MNDKNNKDLLIPKSIDFLISDDKCAYVEGQQKRMNYKKIEIVSKVFATTVAQRGWRRYGKNFVYPACFTCNACKSIRVKATDYKYTKSQRKAIKRNLDTTIVVQEPTLTQEHLDLYNKYHNFKTGNDDWNHQKITKEEYIDDYVDGANDFGKEILYYRDGKLVGVDLVDILYDGISSIYCYYDPDYMWHSLGTYSLLHEIKLAQELELDYVYLGYWVEGYKAFEYKENFQPMEILEGYPRVFEKPIWKPWNREKKD